ncbi:MAG TPA: DUF222 domain-containing protein [Trebonia sp.]|nr:DUF222 domain-containing protein [Trebonia sp.]
MMLEEDEWNPDLLDEDDLAEQDELTPEDAAALFGDSGAEGEDADLLRHITLTLEQRAAGVTEGELALAALMTEGDLWRIDDAGVVGIAVKCREVASRAQGRMYRALQELERRRPARKRYRRGEDVRERRDQAEGIDYDDPPAPRLPVTASAEAASEIALAFTATEYGAEKLAELSADLWARLPRLHLELEAGRTDLDRVNLIWKGTQDLSNEDAGKVDALLSAKSGTMTTGELRDAVRRAVIRIDPEAAEKRRKRAEKNSRVSLYANENHTATLALEDIPAAVGAAAKARVNAIARAAKSAGADDDIGALEAKTAVGLLLGTLPLIPPPIPPDDSPGDPGDPSDSGPGGSGPGGSGPGGGDQGESGPAGGGPAGGGPGDGGPGDGRWDEPAPGGWAGSSGGSRDPAEPMPWPKIPSTSNASASGRVPIPAGLLKQGRIKLLIPWRTLAEMTSAPGELSWFGPVTPGQARDLARAAAADAGARWSLIVTDDDGHAIAFAVLRHPRETETPGLMGEITLTITASLAASLNHSDEMRDRARQLLTGLDPATARLLEEAIGAADKAAVEAELRAILDETAGGCAHTQQADGYKVPETMRRWLMARDRTCRNPICRHRATQCDMDHTLAFGKGGRTCPCDLGAVCRRHHRLKQADGWHLEQDGKGTFTWTTPAGLAYRQEPHQYLV